MRVLIVGAGTMGEIHLRAVQKARGATVVGVVDPDERRALALAKSAGIPDYRSLSAAATSDFDAAIVSTPTYTHLDLSCDLVNAGKHVLVEKPHRLPLEPSAALGEALTAHPQVLYMVGMTHRFYPEARRVHELVSQGAIGESLLVREMTSFHLTSSTLPGWYFQRHTAGGGVLLTNGVHSIDSLVWLFGRRRVRVKSAVCKTIFPDHEVEDFAHVALEMDGGLEVSLTMSWMPYPFQTSRVDIIGTEGCIELYPLEGLKLHTGVQETTERFYEPGQGFWSRTAIGIEAEVAAFIEAVGAGGPSPASFLELEHVLAVIETAYVAAERGVSLDVPSA